MAADEPRSAAETELDAKLSLIRAELSDNDLDAVRLRGSDWFSWLTCGGSSVIDSSLESGVAELLVTATDVLVLADRIDARRIRDEELLPDVRVVDLPWAAPAAREDAVRALLGRGGCVASDRPCADELVLPSRLAAARLRLMPAEIERFRVLGADAACALTATLQSLRPEMTEARVAAIAAEELVGRDMWPVVILVGGARRLPVYRHPAPRADEPIGERAMVVVCARRHGLIVNLTRFVCFRPPTDGERAAGAAVAHVEAAAFNASTAGTTLGDIYRVIAAAYVRVGFAGADADHHQGGLAGYRTREEIATPGSVTPISEGSALAWNPSLPGTKLEDTVVVTPDGLEILSVDPDWPTVTVDGRARPDVLALV
jgi:Xaa-Pro aminopeptidase